MRRLFVLLIAAGAAVGSAMATAQPQPQPQDQAPDENQKPTDNTKPNIMILATGGTIAGKGSAGGHGYTSGQFNVQDLISATPGVEKIANLKGEQIANIGSQDMNDQVWLKLANRVDRKSVV